MNNPLMSKGIPEFKRQLAMIRLSDRAVFYMLLPILVGLSIGLLMIISPWLAAALILGVSLVIAVLMKPVLLCYLVVMGIAWTSGMERGKLIPLLRANEAILVFSLAMAFVIILTKKNRYPVNMDKLGLGMFVLALGTSIIPAAYFLVRGSGLIINDAIVLLGSYQYMLLFWMFVYIPKNNQERLSIVKFMLFCAAVVALIGLVQGLKVGFVLDILNDWYPSPHQAVALSRNRITSLLGSWNGLGIFMMFNLLIIWTFGVSRPSDLGWPTILIEGALFIACLLLSGSFAGMIGVILGVSVIASLMGLFLNKRNVILFFVTAAVLAITFTLFSESVLGRMEQQFGGGGGGFVPATLADRFRIWQNVYLPVIQKNILWGINPTISANYAWQYTESQYLQLLFSFGLVGLTGHVLWNVITIRSLYRRFKEHGSFLKAISAIGIAIIVVLIVTGFSNAVFTYSGTADYMWIMLALVTTEEGTLPKEID